MLSATSSSKFTMPSRWYIIWDVPLEDHKILQSQKESFKKPATKCKPSLYILFFMFLYIKSITSSILPGVNDINWERKNKVLVFILTVSGLCLTKLGLNIVL